MEGKTKVRCTCEAVLVGPKNATGGRMRCPNSGGEVITVPDEPLTAEGPRGAVVWGGAAVVVLVSLGVTFFLLHGFRQQRLRSQAHLAVRAVRSHGHPGHAARVGSMWSQRNSRGLNLCPRPRIMPL
jgi:hypothetical protein